MLKKAQGTEQSIRKDLTKRPIEGIDGKSSEEEI